jgi:hypothetical protein
MTQRRHATGATRTIVAAAITTSAAMIGIAPTSEAQVADRHATPPAARPGDGTPVAQREAGRPGARRRERRSISFTVKGKPDAVFPLFGPVRESEWDPAWQPEFIHPSDGTQSHDGAVFIVRKGGRESIWVMRRYDAKQRELEYVRVTPGYVVAEVEVSIAPAAGGQSRATVTYRYTALSDEGNTFIAHWADEFPKTGPHWGEVINHYITTGRPLVEQAR